MYSINKVNMTEVIIEFFDEEKTFALFHATEEPTGIDTYYVEVTVSDGIKKVYVCFLFESENKKNLEEEIKYFYDIVDKIEPYKSELASLNNLLVENVRFSPVPSPFFKSGSIH